MCCVCIFHKGYNEIIWISLVIFWIFFWFVTAIKIYSTVSRRIYDRKQKKITRETEKSYNTKGTKWMSESGLYADYLNHHYLQVHMNTMYSFTHGVLLIVFFFVWALSFFFGVCSKLNLIKSHKQKPNRPFPVHKTETEEA